MFFFCRILTNWMVGLAYFDSHFAVAYPPQKQRFCFAGLIIFSRKPSQYRHFSGDIFSHPIAFGAKKNSQEDIGLANAGQYLGEAFGSTMRIVWALGLCAAGQSSTMTGAYAGQWVARPRGNEPKNTTKRRGWRWTYIPDGKMEWNIDPTTQKPPIFWGSMLIFGGCRLSHSTRWFE